MLPGSAGRAPWAGARQGEFGAGGVLRRDMATQDRSMRVCVIGSLAEAARDAGLTDF